VSIDQKSLRFFQSRRPEGEKGEPEAAQKRARRRLKMGNPIQKASDMMSLAWIVPRLRRPAARRFTVAMLHGLAARRACAILALIKNHLTIGRA
jgi:hypothetical protein